MSVAFQPAIAILKLHGRQLNMIALIEPRKFLLLPYLVHLIAESLNNMGGVLVKDPTCGPKIVFCIQSRHQVNDTEH